MRRSACGGTGAGEPQCHLIAVHRVHTGGWLQAYKATMECKGGSADLSYSKFDNGRSTFAMLFMGGIMECVFFGLFAFVGCDTLSNCGCQQGNGVTVVFNFNIAEISIHFFWCRT